MHVDQRTSASGAIGPVVGAGGPRRRHRMRATRHPTVMVFALACACSRALWLLLRRSSTALLAAALGLTLVPRRLGSDDRIAVDRLTAAAPTREVLR